MGKVNMDDHEHLHIYCEKDLKERIVAFRFDHHVKTQNKAIIMLLEAALKALEKEKR